jgi:phage protein D
MAEQDLFGPSVRALAVEVNGRRLNRELDLTLSAVTVEEHVDLPSMFTLELIADDGPGGREPASWIDDHRVFAIGDEIQIKLGQLGSALQPVITGEVTALDIEFTNDGSTRLTVRGYDRRHRLQRGRRVRTFVKRTDSNIAEIIAGGAGLGFEGDDSGTIHEHVIQANQTDLAFLQERARRINYEVVIEDRTLYFRPVAYDSAPVLSLSIDNELSAFRARFTSAGQVSRVEARGWSVKAKEAVVARASTCPRMGEESTRSAAQVGKVFGEAEELLSWEPVDNREEADARANARLAAIGLGLVRGEGVCMGRPDLRAGKVIEIEGIGKRFSGPYYVKAVSHNYGPEGYSTQFTAWRNST